MNNINEAIEERMARILNDDSSMDMMNNMKNQINEGGILVNKKEGSTMESKNIDINVESQVIGEKLITSDDGTTSTVPVVNADVTIAAGMPVVAAAPVPETPTEAPKKTVSKSKKKNDVDLDAIEKEFIENFDTMNHEMRFDHLVKLCGETAASSAKKLDLKPANRILESVRGNRALKGEVLDKVYNFYKNHEELKNRPNVVKLLTPEFFVG